MTTPNSSQNQTSYVHDDEISLVDLAKILIKRWKILVFTFLVVVVGAALFVLLQARTYQYVSIYQVAEQAGTDSGSLGLESPNAVIAKVQNLYLGPVTRELQEASEFERLPFEVAVNSPEHTLLVRLSSEASENHGALVAHMHERLLERIVEDQTVLLERSRERLESQLQSARQAFSTAQESDVAGDIIAIHLTRIAELETQLAQLSDGQVVQVAVQSLEPTGTSRILILALGIVLGGILALMAAFLSHFASLVRLSLSEE